MSLNNKPLAARRQPWWSLLAITTALALAGCGSEQDKRTGISSDAPHAQWASITNLDPHKEECAGCHGKTGDMSVYTSTAGTGGHNIGLQYNATPASLGVEGMEIESVIVNKANGMVTVTLNQPLPASANFGITFAKLAPRVRHNRGHDWQNYLNLVRDRSTQATALLDYTPRPQPLDANVRVLSEDRRTITFDMSGTTGNQYHWAEHSFTVTDINNTTHSFTNVLGTKRLVPDLSEHTYCDAAHTDTNQLASDLGKIVCWWPDGTALPSGTFVSDNNEFIVAYEEGYTHRIGLQINGRPGYNVWYDFVPATGNKIEAEDYATANGTNPPTTHLGIQLTDITQYLDGTPVDFTTGNAAQLSTKYQKLPATREVVDVASCNSCHDSLTMHGGSRSQTQMCVTCHNPGNLEANSGRSVDLKQLVHRIHRGNNLPSELSSIKDLMDGRKTLLSEAASDWTQVRFPQGPTPGTAAGITNCVKCHMGEGTQELVQKLSDEVGPGAGYNVQEQLKLAKTTPQGDNWLSVRSVDACQACHDSNVWFADGNINQVNPGIADRNSAALIDTYKLDLYLPFYSSQYTDIGYDWLGKKLLGSNAIGWVHNTQIPGDNGRFTCGSSGGCHSNADVATILANNTGNDSFLSLGDRDAGGNRVHRRHLELTRDYLIAERFEVRILDAGVNESGFWSEIGLWDKNTQQYIKAGDSITDLGEVMFNLQAMFGWMKDGSADYNHSTGAHANPAAPTANIRFVNADHSEAIDTTFLSATTTYRVERPWSKVGIQSNGTDRGLTFQLSDFNPATSKGTAFVLGNLSIGGKTVRVRSANQDFAFNGAAIDMANNPARRQVVDFKIGRGVDFAHQDGNVQSCSSCHLQLSFHGNSRTNNTQLCIACHNPSMTDINNGGRSGQLGNDGQYEESEDFKRLIHAVHASADFRIDPIQHRANQRPGPTVGNSFPGVLSNCQGCHVENKDGSGKWTYELDQLPKDLIGSTAITGDWASTTYAADSTHQHLLENHQKMTPITSVCSSCHDAGYKTTDGRMNTDIRDGGPYVGSHWWEMGGRAPGAVRPGQDGKDTLLQSGK